MISQWDHFLVLLNQTTPLQWLLCFVVMTITDVCWAKYTKTAADSKPLPASLWSVSLFVLGGLTVVTYTSNPVLLIPASIGAFVGTYIGATE